MQYALAAVYRGLPDRENLLEATYAKHHRVYKRNVGGGHDRNAPYPTPTASKAGQAQALRVSKQ